MKIEADNDTVILWKSTNIDLGNDRFMFVIYYYHTTKGERNKSFYKCNIRIDTKENWMKLRDSLVKENPAEYFRTSMLGLEDDYKLYYSRHTVTKADVFKWIGSKFSPNKTTSMDAMLNKESGLTEPFLMKYNINGTETDISDIQHIPEGIWFSALKDKKTVRKQPRVIQ